MGIKHETIMVTAAVLYCDGCGARGPESVYDIAFDAVEQAGMDGWDVSDEEDTRCPECLAKAKT